MIRIWIFPQNRADFPAAPRFGDEKLRYDNSHGTGNLRNRRQRNLKESAPLRIGGLGRRPLRRGYRAGMPRMREARPADAPRARTADEKARPEIRPAAIRRPH